jgi:hypothetical protein
VILNARVFLNVLACMRFRLMRGLVLYLRDIGWMFRAVARVFLVIHLLPAPWSCWSVWRCILEMFM